MSFEKSKAKIKNKSVSLCKKFSKERKIYWDLVFRIIRIKTDQNTVFRESPLIFCTLFPTCFHHSSANIKELQVIKKRNVKQILYSM